MEKVIEPYICINHGEKTPCRWCSNSKLGTNKFDVPEVIGQSSIKEVHDNMESKPPVFGPANIPVDLDTIYPGITTDDPVNHPKHYTSHPSGIECIAITRHMSFNLGNVIKYIWRADEKGFDLEDLKKAAWYLADEIAMREKKNGPSST